MPNASPRGSARPPRGSTTLHPCYFDIRSVSLSPSRRQMLQIVSPRRLRFMCHASHSSIVELGHTGMLCGSRKMRCSHNFSAERMCAIRPRCQRCSRCPPKRRSFDMPANTRDSPNDRKQTCVENRSCSSSIPPFLSLPHCDRSRKNDTMTQATMTTAANQWL